MSHYFQLHPSRYEYPEFRRLHEDHDDARVLHSPLSGHSMEPPRGPESPQLESNDGYDIPTEELVRNEEEDTGVVVLKKVKDEEEEEELTEEGIKKTDEIFLKNEPDEKEDNDKESKEDDKNAETFVAVIAQSILSVPTKRMTLSSIYSYIAKNYPHFDKEKGPGWRNSVRHNLSSNDCFVKASRAENGKGHYWMIHPKDLPEFAKGNFRRRRKPRRPKCSHSLMFRDAPLYYHTYGIGCSPYGYSSLRTSQDFPEHAYGSTNERSLSYRPRVSLVSPYEESSSRYGVSSYPYSSCPSNISLRGYSGESSLLRSSSSYPLSSYNSPFHAVNHYPCACHR